ncbi:universal stress protein [Marinococcus halophilus]|uniref:UspA domain-containing protein n=1 Tax=Marinococcus halophilus TaxID=1371 RepID=A0A510Y4F0_MARHA|nr:universal stress protein [Marinococcus halophilus]OZT80165.1 universal stress protein [Marinococcus halophilus]GEK58215.1 hypothetical protein MHA01_11200 [Marinococcus halophilus]
MEQFQRILVGVETLEATSHDPLAHAVQLAQEHQATLLIAFMMDTKGYSPFERMDPNGFRRLQAQASSQLQRLKEWAVEQGVPQVETIMEPGLPKRDIGKICARYETDLVVLGESGASKIDRAFLGNTAKSVQKKVDCNVKVIST